MSMPPIGTLRRIAKLAELPRKVLSKPFRLVTGAAPFPMQMTMAPAAPSLSAHL